MSKCAKCGHSSFELKQTRVRSSNYDLYFVQCSSCGAPFGVIEGRNTTDMFMEQNRLLNQLALKMGLTGGLPE